VEVSKAIAVGGLHGEGENGGAWVGGGGDEFNLMTEEGGAPSLEQGEHFRCNWNGHGNHRGT